MPLRALNKTNPVYGADSIDTSGSDHVTNLERPFYQGCIFAELETWSQLVKWGTSWVLRRGIWISAAAFPAANWLLTNCESQDWQRKIMDCFQGPLKSTSRGAKTGVRLGGTKRRMRFGYSSRSHVTISGERCVQNTSHSMSHLVVAGLRPWKISFHTNIQAALGQHQRYEFLNTLLPDLRVF